MNKSSLYSRRTATPSPPSGPIRGIWFHEDSRRPAGVPSVRADADILPAAPPLKGLSSLPEASRLQPPPCLRETSRGRPGDTVIAERPLSCRCEKKMGAGYDN